MNTILDAATKKLLDENLLLNIKIKQLEKQLELMKTKKPKENI